MDSGFNPFTDPCNPTPPGCPDRVGLQGSKVGFPIRRSSDQSSFAAPQGLSQRTTSFIASQRQGIHRTPLRHLIALMIHARPQPSATRLTIKADRTRQNRPFHPRPRSRSLGFACRTHPIQTLSGWNQACSLFTMSNTTIRYANRDPSDRTGQTPLNTKVELDGIEPTTSCLQSTRSPN